MNMNDIKQQQNIATQVWENHGNEEYRKDQSHWKGVGRWKNEEAWLNIGKNTKKRLFWLARANGVKFEGHRKYSILEWGQGGGANAVGLKDIAKTYYGVDISISNLNEANRIMLAEGSNAFVPIHLQDEPSEVLSHIQPQSLDMFISTAVFQHFPSKEYGFEVLSAVKEMMKNGGLCYVQFRYDNGNPKYKPNQSIDDYEERHICANSYSIDEFWSIVSNIGFQPICIRDIYVANNYASIYFKK